ncbi:MAG: hypothetical protein NTY45_01575 [Elusimicrobia bacterium]|nr:hypothetical protein [Elusimicrobiota bacterium]
MTSPVLLLLLLAAGPAGAAELGTAAAVSAWHIKSSPHFEVLHESAWSPNSVSLELEKMFSTMRLNLAMFAPWMASEKSKIYIYSSQESFVGGEFAPPKWSKGLAYPAKKKAVLAHELAHLYFEGYFAEKLKYPPQWLNEGLAVYLEDIVFQEGGPWRQALPYFDPPRRFPLDQFFTAKLDALGADSRISDWYLQAFGTVSYLYAPNTRLQFKNFCEALRNGDTTETALWKSYRISSSADFARKWEAWLNDYAGASGGQGGSSAALTFKPAKLTSFGFTEFGKKK